METKQLYARIRLQVALALARDLQHPDWLERLIDARGLEVLSPDDARRSITAICHDPGVVRWYPATCGMLTKLI